jgi:SAM-dependent methyltransferase
MYALMTSAPTSLIEQTKQTYELVALDFSRTRFSIWNSVKFFLNNIPKYFIGLEIGCGNGKNLDYCINNLNINIIGCDLCKKFVDICKEKKLPVFQADMRNIGLKSQSFDFIISVAVLHHLPTLQLRIKAIKEMVRLGTRKCLFFISVWAFEQPPEAKRKFTLQDELIPWKSRIDNKTYFRYYHLYKINELLQELYYVGDFNILYYIYEEGNYSIIFTSNSARNV